MVVYGIKTCGSVKKALKFFKDNNIEYEFLDFKKDSAGCEKIDEWVEKVGIDVLLQQGNKIIKRTQL